MEINTFRPDEVDNWGKIVLPHDNQPIVHGVESSRLPDILMNGEEWAAKAMCKGTDPDKFFPERGGSTREARQICRSCPVCDECREFAVKKNEKYGVWGDTVEKERRAIIKQRKEESSQNA